MAKRKKPVKIRKKPVKRRKKTVESNLQKDGVFSDNLTPEDPALPPDPMLEAYVNEIHKAAEKRDRRIFEAKQKFAWDLADAWQRWKEEG